MLPVPNVQHVTPHVAAWHPHKVLNAEAHLKRAETRLLVRQDGVQYAAAIAAAGRIIA